MTRYFNFREDIIYVLWFCTSALAQRTATHALRPFVLVVSRSLPAHALRLSIILQYIAQPRRRLLRQGSVRVRLPIELILRKRELRTVVPSCPGVLHLGPHRVVRLIPGTTILILDHLIDLVEVWVLLVASLPRPEHFVLRERLPLIVYFFFDLLTILEFIFQNTLLENTGLVWVLVGLIWLEEFVVSLLPVRVDVVRWAGHLLNPRVSLHLGQVLLGLGTRRGLLSQLCLIQSAATAMVTALDILASESLEGIGIPKQLLALLQDGGRTDDGVAQENLRALGARLQLAGRVVRRRLRRHRALHSAVALRVGAVEDRPLRRLRCVRALRWLLCYW